MADRSGHGIQRLVASERGGSPATAGAPPGPRPGSSPGPYQQAEPGGDGVRIVKRKTLTPGVAKSLLELASHIPSLAAGDRERQDRSAGSSLVRTSIPRRGYDRGCWPS